MCWVFRCLRLKIGVGNAFPYSLVTLINSFVEMYPFLLGCKVLSRKKTSHKMMRYPGQLKKLVQSNP